MLPAPSPFLDARPIPDPAKASNAFDDAGNLSVALNLCNFDKDAAKVEWVKIRNFFAGKGVPQ